MTQLEQYSVLVVLALLVAAFVVGLLLLERILEQKVGTGYKSASQEETRQKPAWRRYHVQYYIFALLFLAFDMEMAYMYPWAVVYRELGLVALLDMGVFLLILFLGLLYAWSQQGLRRQ